MADNPLPTFPLHLDPGPSFADLLRRVAPHQLPFADVGATPAFACTFSFRIPKGAKLARFTIDTVSIPLGAMGQ